MVTDAMIEAGVAVYRNTVSHGATLTEALPAIYTAMSAASVDDEMVERVAREIETYGEGLVPELRLVCSWLAAHFRNNEDAKAALAAVKLEGVGEP